MVTTKQYDLLNRLTNISSSSSTFSFSSSAYKYNDANQRTNRTDLDGSYWVYTYDVLGQVTSGKKYWPDGAPVAGQQFEYGFDNIGNRTMARSGGDQFGANLRSANYTNNSLNQITSRDVPGYFNSIGSANSNATVTLWRDDGEYATNYRHGDYFRAELPVNNSTGAIWLTLTNLAVLQTGTNHDIIASLTGNAFVPKTSELFSYDLDGNTTSDGRWTNLWDAENRLISMESLTNGPTGSKLRLTFGYDHQGRRMTKLVESWTNSAWSVTDSNKFVYDGWNLIAELNGSNNAVIRSYMWGSDMSDTPQGAGGVGGLLAVSDSNQGVHFPSYDGNGNAQTLVAAVDGTQSATYTYGPFGEILRMTGPMAKLNSIRFSTKYQDDQTYMLYYGRRYYAASSGRWLSRDPLTELGGANLYAMVGNNAISSFDLLGMASPEQMLRVMDSIFKLLNRINCDCPDESAYLKCILGEVNDAFAKSGYIDAIKQGISQVEAWKVDVSTAGRDGLNPDVANKLDEALNQLAKSAGGIAEKANSIRECHNKCIERVTRPANTAVELYEGDSINAAMTALDAIGKLAGDIGGDAAAPLKPILQWLKWYKKAYNAASKKLNEIGMDGLENALNTIQSQQMTECDEINPVLGKAVAGPAAMRRNCMSKLKSGVGL